MATSSGLPIDSHVISRFAFVMTAVLLLFTCAASGGELHAEKTSAPRSDDPTREPFFDAQYKAFSEGINGAWNLTNEGYALMGGFPSIESTAPLNFDQLPAAARKFEESLALLDRSAMPGVSHDRYPYLYAHSDYVRAADLQALAMIALVDDDLTRAEELATKAIGLVEGSFKVSQVLKGQVEYDENARNCAVLGLELHEDAASFAGGRGDTAEERRHEARAKELADWLQAAPPKSQKATETGDYYNEGDVKKYYANVEDIRVYENPDPAGLVFEGDLTIGHEFRETSEPGEAPPGWLHAEFHYPGEGLTFIGWVLTKDVVNYRSFSRVTHDWPVRYWCYWTIDGPPRADPVERMEQKLGAGPAVFEVTFERTGVAHVTTFHTEDWGEALNDILNDIPFPGENAGKEAEGEPERSERQSYTGQVYRSGNVVMLRYGKKGRVGFTFGLDASTSRFYGGESWEAKGQGVPETRLGREAFAVQFRFGEPVQLSTDAAKYCTNAPGY
jgi:hypothetical protein